MGSTYEQVKGKFKTTAETRIEKRYKRRATTQSTTVLAFSGQPDKLTLMEGGRDLGFIRHARAEAYMHRILNRLSSKWPYETPKVGAFIRASNSFSPSSTSSDILIPIAVFEAVDSEDQLAAILAHEFSHILLHHHEQIDQRRSLTKGVATAGSLAAAMAYASEVRVGRNSGGQIDVGMRDAKVADKRAFYASAAQMTILTLMNDIVGPGWSRTQESEADLLGVDLLEAAGYDGRAMIEVLRKHGAAEKRLREVAEDYSNKYGKELAQAAATMNIGSIFGAVKNVAVDAGSNALAAVGDKLRRDHPDSETRIKDIQAYLNREYRDALHEEDKRSYAVQWRAIRPVREMYRPVFEAQTLLRAEKHDDAQRAIERALAGSARDAAGARYVAYQVFLKKNDSENAYRHLLAIRNWDDAPIGAYAALAMHHARHRKITEGESVLRRAEIRFGSSEIVLPSRIGMYRSANCKTEMDAHLALCRKLDDSDIRSSCESAGQSDKVAVAEQDNSKDSTIFSGGGKTFLGGLTSSLGF